MATDVKIIFYSMYGHVYRLAEAIAWRAQPDDGLHDGQDQDQGRHEPDDAVPELVPAPSVANGRATDRADGKHACRRLEHSV